MATRVYGKMVFRKKGTIKVVTGAGKTILALAIIESLKKQITELVVAIVVPTIVLQNQWYNEILKNSNLSDNMIGRLGGDMMTILVMKKNCYRSSKVGLREAL